MGFRIFTPPEETEHGTRAGGRGPGGVPGGVGSKNRGGHVRVYRGGLSVYRGGSIPIAILPVCLSVCLFVCATYSKLNSYIEGILTYIEFI